MYPSEKRPAPQAMTGRIVVQKDFWARCWDSRASASESPEPLDPSIPFILGPNISS